MSPLYIQRCNHDRSATQNLTPISRCFKYISAMHFYPYFAQNGYKLAFKKHPYFSNSKYTFIKTPLFSQFQVYTFTESKTENCKQGPQGPEEKKHPFFQFRVQAQNTLFSDFEYKLMKTTLFFKIANISCSRICFKKDPFLREIWNDHAYTKSIQSGNTGIRVQYSF